MKRKSKQSLTKRLKEAVQGLAQPERSITSAAAFGRLYEEKHVLVFRHIYGLCGGQTALAEDLTAETFMRAWQARGNFSGSWAGATGWLLRIGRNLVIDYHRQGIEKRTAALVDEAAYPTTATLPEDAVLAAEQEGILLALLQELTMEKREMITLRYLLGWRVNEIAAYLEMPENTVSVTIQRTLKQMRYRWPMAALKEQEHVEI